VRGGCGISPDANKRKKAQDSARAELLTRLMPDGPGRRIPDPERAGGGERRSNGRLITLVLVVDQLNVGE
jgi:hypothetical protein